jgi:hypothetical protein
MTHDGIGAVYETLADFTPKHEPMAFAKEG